MSTTKRKVVFRLLAIFSIIYLTMIGVFYIFQNAIIFQADVLPADHHFQFDVAHQEYFIPTDKNEHLNAILFKSPLAAKGLILYFHGNDGNLQRWGNYATDFTSKGFDILMVDYRGYGKSEGKATEDLLYKDALTIWSWLSGNLDYDRKIIYGRSLGAAVASNLATRVTPEVLILETPFHDATGPVTRLLGPWLNIFPLKYRFSNIKHLSKVNCDVYIFHGTEDLIVPYESALKLKSLLGNDGHFITIQGANHKNLSSYPLFHEKLEAILEQ